MTRNSWSLLETCTKVIHNLFYFSLDFQICTIQKRLTGATKAPNFTQAQLTNKTIPKISTREIEDVVLVPSIAEVNCFYFKSELLNKRTSVNGLGVGIRIPRFFFYS